MKIYSGKSLFILSFILIIALFFGLIYFISVTILLPNTPRDLLTNGIHKGIKICLPELFKRYKEVGDYTKIIPNNSSFTDLINNPLDSDLKKMINNSDCRYFIKELKQFKLIELNKECFLYELNLKQYYNNDEYNIMRRDYFGKIYKNAPFASCQNTGSCYFYISSKPIISEYPYYLLGCDAKSLTGGNMTGDKKENY